MSKFQKLNRNELDDLYKKVLFKTLFHDLNWFDFLEKEFKWLKFEHYLYKPARRSLGGGGDEALLNFGRFIVFGKEKLISLPFCEYGGPLPLPARRSLGGGGKEGIDFEEFNKDVLEEFSENIKIKFHPQILKYFTYPASNIQHLTSNISTHWIENLKHVSEQGLLNSFRKTLRHSIRNAERCGLEIRKCSNLKELKQFYNLYLVNLKRKKTVPYPLSVIKYLYERPESEILLAFYSAQGGSASGGKNKIIAGDLFVHYDKFVHYLFSASDYKYRNLGANYLILWEKIKSLCGQDKIFDLGAAPNGSPLEIFKRGWGGKEYPIYQIGTRRSPAFAKASAGREESLRYSKIRNIWGLLPVFVINKISRYFIKYRI